LTLAASFVSVGKVGVGVLWRKLIEAVAGGKSLIVNK
jgi:hypothetical protein